MGFVNYLDARSEGCTKTAYMEGSTRLIVSLQSLHLVGDLQRFKGGVFCLDEARSAMSIVGGETLGQPTVEMNMLRE
eukprot:6334762-Prymnesium_polylepis.1